MQVEEGSMPKGWFHNLQGLIFQTNRGIGVLEIALKVVGQWND
jgi:hypothetical protein